MAKKASESKSADAKKSSAAGKTKAAPAAPSGKNAKAKAPKAAAAPKAVAKSLFPDAAAEPAAPKKPAAKKEPTAPKRAFNSDEIGHVAGDVWQVLNDDGSKTAAELTKAVAAPPELVAAALGWLAREGKLEFETNGRSVTVSLA